MLSAWAEPAIYRSYISRSKLQHLLRLRKLLLVKADKRISRINTFRGTNVA